MEPAGLDYYYVDIAVGDGGVLRFDYALETWDAGIWDWMDIYLETPTGTLTLIDHLGKPGSQYGTYWSSPPIAYMQPLGEWIDQNVRLVVSVRHDGWGDQTAGRIRNLVVEGCSSPPDMLTSLAVDAQQAAQACAPCNVGPISPMTDPEALAMEGGQSVNMDGLTPEMLVSVECFIEQLSGGGGSISITSAYRPPAYQAHLREVWEKREALKDNTEQACAQRKQQVLAHFAQHGLLPSQKPALTSKHTQGLAIDANVVVPAGVNRDQLALGCSLFRPVKVKDPVHYILVQD